MIDLFKGPYQESKLEQLLSDNYKNEAPLPYIVINDLFDSDKFKSNYLGLDNTKIEL
jgi:hypothetical protein